MNLKLLIAACCLLAVVQARPQRPLSSSCSVSCVSRTFWSGYQAGNVYTYDFDQSVELSSELNPSQASRLRINGQAKVEVHSDCEMALTVQVKNAHVGSVNDASAFSPRDPPAKVLAGLRAPLRFAFDNGRVVELCPSAEETRASLNLKRGLLSQLQVSTEQRGQAHELEERDILGDCWTEYAPAGPNTLIKTKDLAKCKLNYQAYPLLGVKSFEDETTQSKRPITKGSLTCRIEIDTDRDIVKSTSCQEEQRQSARHQSDSIEEKIRTTTRLTLKSEESGLVNALHEVSKRTDLRHGHKTGSQCQKAGAWLDEDLFHSANECVERSHGAETSAEYLAKANKTLEELCKATKDQDMSRDVPRKYADLIKYMRGITEKPHLAQLYQQVRAGVYCNGSPLLLAIMRSAIPTVGTKQSVAFIIDELRNSGDSTGRNDWIVNGVALMQHPTPEILPEMLSYVRYLRDQEHAIIAGVNRDEPLALSAVVHKICQELPNCESESRVKAVIDYFANSLGHACAKFSGADSDNAFVALLAIGNMGRMSDGGRPLVQCAANQRLPTVYRAFALHSLRRFSNFSTDAQTQLIEMLLDAEQDAEVRIAAYQALARHGFSDASRLREAVRRLLDDTDADRQVQMFVYTHLQTLKGQDARMMSPVLLSAKTTSELKKLSRRQYSNVLKGQYYSPALEAGAQAEVPIVFSAQSAIPRYIGLNLTVNLPSQGQSINLMEIGLRIQGLEKLIEQTYSQIAKKYGSAAPSDEAPPAPERPDDLSDEQRRLTQTPTEPRIDLFVRRYGAELSHTDLSGGILESLPALISSGQAGSFMPAGRRPGPSAGTLMESTLSIPTTAGLPILVKQEAHYITNLRSDMNISQSAGVEATVQLQPTAAMQMLRTVAVDAIFERAGIQSSTSFLTSTGLRIRMKKNLESSSDRQLLVKIEPLQKKQNVAEVKTEVKFFQHTAGKEHVEKALTPQQTSVQSEKCIEGLAKQLGGHKICYKTESLPNCQTSTCKLLQCPSTYQLFLEKNDDFGAFELSYKWKNQRSQKQLQLLIGDQKSKERLLKLNIQSISLSRDKINYKLELQNPIFPINIDSNFTKSGTGQQVNSKAQVGSVEYVATGSVRPDSEKGIIIAGEFYPKEKTEQKVQVSLEHKFSGFTPMLLPIATTKLQAKMHTNNEINLEYDLKLEESNFFWQMSSEYKTQKGQTTAVRYRVQYRKSPEGSADASTVFLYDFALQNPLGKNLMHSLHSKLIRRPDAEGMQYSATVSHKLQYGSESAKSPLDFDARFAVKKIEQSQKTEISGGGEFTYSKEGKAVTAKVERLKIEVGEFTNATDGFGKQYKYAVNYGIKFEDQTAEYQVELQHLPWGRWSLGKQAVQLKAVSQLGSKNYAVNLKHALNAEKWQSEQIAKAEYNDYVYFHIESKLKKTEGIDTIRHEFFLQDSQNNKLDIKSGLTRPQEGVVNADVIVKKNTEKILSSTHSLHLKQAGKEGDHELKHKMTLETLVSTYSVENSIKIDQESLSDIAELMTYQVRLVAGRYRISKSLQLLFDLLSGMRLEHESKLTGPASTQQITIQNTVQLESPEGDIWKHLLQMTGWSESQEKYGVSVTRTKDSAGTSGKEIKFELYYKDQSVKSKASYNGDLGSLKIASMDTWGWHNIKMGIAIRFLATSTRIPRYEALANIEGQISMVRLNSSLNITSGQEDSENYFIATLTVPQTKLRLMLKLFPVQKAGELKFDGEFGVLPFKSMKAKSYLSLEKGVQFESEAEVDSAKIIATKLQIEKDSFMADLKTGHPLLQEAGIKIRLETDIPEAIKFDVVAKIVSLTKQMQIKKSGTATLSRNSPGYSFLWGLTGKAELEGFEGQISYKKLEYELMLKKKPTMEFQLVASVSSPDHTDTKEPMLFLTSSLNYWPFKAEAKVKAKNYRGWEVKYGARSEVDNKNAFVGVEYNDKEAAATYEIEDLSCGTRKVNFRVKCTFCSNTARDLIVGQANMTYPLQPTKFQLGLDMDLASSKLQMIAFRIEHKPSKKQIMAVFRWDGSTQKLIDCAYTQMDAAGDIKGKVLLHSDLRFFLGETARAKLRASYNYGSEKSLNISLSMADIEEQLLNAKLFWLNAPRSYPSIPEANVDRGMRIQGLGIDAYLVRVVKSANNFEWKSSVQLPKVREPITANWEYEDAAIKSGKVNAFGREFALTSSPEGELQVTLRTGSEGDDSVQVKWSGKYENLQDMRAKIEIEANGEANIIEANVQPKQIVVNYGKSAGPNSLQIDYELNDSSVDLTIKHETDAEKNTELTLWPNYNIQVPTTRYPMKLTASARAWIRTVSIFFEAPGLSVKTMDYRHDFTNFPKTFKTSSNLVSTNDEKIWKIKINVDMDMRSIETICKIGDKFSVSFKEPKFELQLEDTVDLKVQFPKFLSDSEDSDKKELTVQLALPVMAINRPISWKVSMQQLTEGRQMKIQYGLVGDTEQIVWQLTARKYRFKPRLNVDLDTSLTSKFDLLYSWKIRSLEARLESRMEGNSDAYTAVYKDSIKVNGEDLSATDARIDGQSGVLLKKAELQITGKMECNLKFESSSEDEPAKLSFSLDKFGDSLQKYSLKLSYKPAKQNAVLPDFRVETECPHRQLVIGKEFRETASESMTIMDFYLNKRQSHGATIIYKSESPASETPKYVLEIVLPTRKIRIDCQPEVSDNRVKVKNSFAWDADVSTEKVIEMTTRLETGSNIDAELEFKAPFLRNPVKLEARVENKETGYTVQLKHKNGESDVLTLKADCSYESQETVRFTLEVRGTENSKFSLSARAQKDTENYMYDWYKIDGTLKWKISSQEKNIKFLYRPMREITVSCDHGTSLSLKYSADGKNLCQLVAFASSNDKNAARMKLLVSAPTKKITIKLDKGRGSFNHNYDLRLPNYTPEKVMLRSKISFNSSDLIATAFLGEMTVGQRPDVLDAASVPTHLSFFGFVYRVMDNSKVNFHINWRTPSQEKIDSAMSSLQRSLSSYKSSAVPALSGVRKGLAPLFSGASSNIDADWIVEEVRSLASNDIDQLTRYVERVLSDDEFFLGSTLNAWKSASRYIQEWFSALSEAVSSWKEALDELQIPQCIAQWFQWALNTAVNWYNKIPIQDAIDSLVALMEQVKNIANSWNEKLTEMIDSLQNWLSDSTYIRGIWNSDQAQEYLEVLAPFANVVKETVARIWAKASTMLAATIAGSKPLAVDDMLPLGMNHIADFQIIRNLYNNLMLELRVWYDTGASLAEREALSQSSQLMSYIFSEESMNTWSYLAETAQLMLNGEIREGIARLGDQIRYTVWRPECNDACQRGQAPHAAVEGELIYNNYLPKWSSYNAPQIVLRRVFYKLTRRGLPKTSNKMAAIIKLALGNWNPAARLLAIRHRTAILSGDNHLITFDGVALSHERPCSYLVARDFECSDFSIVQEYHKDSANPERQVRGSLQVRFGQLSLSVERNGTVTMNGKIESLPLEKSSDDKSVDANREGDLVTVRFHGKLSNTLVIRCSRSADSCLVSVHPLYQGRVLGLAGSNDGRRENDIREGRASRHVNFWTAGQCEAEAASDSSAKIADEPSYSDSGDCYNWFSSNKSPMSDCFETVDPRPFRSICRQQKRQDGDACDAVRQYKARCTTEGINIRVPSKCVACEVDRDGPIVKAGKVSHKASLQRRMQVVFLVEENACGTEAAVPAERIKELAEKIDRLKSTNKNLKSVQFGIASYGEALSSQPVSGERLFGSYTELEAALDSLRLPAVPSSSPMNALQAVADLSEQYQWEHLAQKHLFVITCTPCSGVAWNYNALFAKAQRSVKDQIYVHTISKTAIEAAAQDSDEENVIGHGATKYYTSSERAVQMNDEIARRFKSECTAELALDADNKAKGSVWRLDKFYESDRSGENQVTKLLVANEVARHLRQPRCRQCSCQDVITAAKCKIVECGPNGQQ